jgi:hypothetical protein
MEWTGLIFLGIVIVGGGGAVVNAGMGFLQCGAFD